MAAQKSAARAARKSRSSLNLRGDAQWLLGGLLVGILLVPPLIWLTGLAVIGPYANGGMWALFGDAALALRQGSLAAWTVMLAPAALVLIWRVCLRALQR